MIETISGHTIEKSLLNRGVCIDVGCRDFSFSLKIKELGLTVFSYDVENFTAPNGINFINKAVSTKTGFTSYYWMGEGTFISEVREPDTNMNNYKPIESISINDIYKEVGENVDVLKLDCEGTEYFLLTEDFRPIPKQITVEFHEHCFKKLHDEKFNEALKILSNDYEMMYYFKENTYQYIDTLFIRRW